MKKRQEAILQMWGGLWANEAGKPNMNLGMGPWGGMAGGLGGYQYPYQVVPGVPAQAGIQWMGKPPDGWQSWVLIPVPMGIYPIQQPFKRT